MKYHILRFVVVMLSMSVLISCGPSDKIRPSQRMGPIWVNRYGHTNAEFIWDHCIAEMPKEPGTSTVDCDIPWVDELFIGYGIRAVDEAQRDAIWETRTWEMYIDGQAVDLPAFNIMDFDTDEGENSYFYRLWRIRLRKIPDGLHTLRYVMHVNQEVANDPDPRPVGTYELSVNFNFNP